MKLLTWIKKLSQLVIMRVEMGNCKYELLLNGNLIVKYRDAKNEITFTIKKPKK